MSFPRVAIVDVGIGNLYSIYKAFDYLGASVERLTTPLALKAYDATHVVIPGVGAFAAFAAALDRDNWRDTLTQICCDTALPTLGICLGMQILATWGEEGGKSQGLNWISGKVSRLSPSDSTLRIPHVGWNNVIFQAEHPVFTGNFANQDFYFVHSYAFQCQQLEHQLGICDYGGAFTAIVGRDNLIGTQFHPEKSQQAGLQLFENFLNWRP